MPNYLRSSSLLGGDGSCCKDNTIDRSSAFFLNTMATKLLAMSKAIEVRFDEIRKKCTTITKSGPAFFFASIETPTMVISVPVEYTEYIRRYGPPHRGKFDREKLHHIRYLLGIVDTHHHHHHHHH